MTHSPPYTLGISYGFHDASAALVRDGHVLAASSEERFSRQKHDRHFPKQAIAYCLQQAGIELSDIEKVAYHEKAEHTFSRVLTSTLAGFPGTRREFVAAMKAWLGDKLWTKTELCTRLSVKPEQLRSYHHHTSHAAQAFLGSAFQEAAVLTLDAVGEWTTTGLFHARRTASGPQFSTLQEIEFPHSLGLFYSAMTAYLGFRPMDGECSTMALAAFGAPKYVDRLHEVLVWEGDQFYLDQSFFHFTDFYLEPFSDKMVELLGPARSHDQPLPFYCWQSFEASVDAQRFADIAASVQAIYERTVLRLAHRLAKETGSTNLCIAGGGALNCVANARILAETSFANLYIPIDPGDGGAAVGAALLADHEHGRSALPDSPVYTPFLGREARDDTLDFLGHLQPEHSRRYRKLGLKMPRHRYESVAASSDEELVDRVSSDIADGLIVGWCQGRFENGPRALGARSILIRPDDLALATRLSCEVKDRAGYRPYGLMLSEAESQQMLAITHVQTPHRWMQLAAKVTDVSTNAAVKAKNGFI